MDERLFNPSGIVNWSPRVSSGSTFTLRRRCKRFCLVEGGKERKRSQMLSGRYIQAHEHGVQREKSTYESWMALWLSCIALLFRADIAGQSYTAGRADRSCALAISARESCDECRPTAQQQPLLISLSNHLFSSFFLFFSFFMGAPRTKFCVHVAFWWLWLPGETFLDPLVLYLCYPQHTTSKSSNSSASATTHSIHQLLIRTDAERARRDVFEVMESRGLLRLAGMHDIRTCCLLYIFILFVV